MGLDITAYRKLKIEDFPDLDQYGIPNYNTRIQFYENPDFPDRTTGLLSNQMYEWEEQFDFGMGSYGGYNEWRSTLARLVGRMDQEIWDDPRPGPFVELINFADNEGTIGPVISAKLAKDFQDWEEAARIVGNGDDWFLDRYLCWKRAFEMAADRGAVRFH